MVQGIPIPIEVEPNFTPTTDNTALAATGIISMDKIRIWDGQPETLGGWESIAFESNATISGVCRGLYSQVISNLVWLMIGTHTRLYSNTRSELTNVTPLLTATTNLGADPVTTYFPTLANNPLTTVNGSMVVTVAHTAHRLQVGDLITMAGAATTNGIPNTDFNATHIIRTVPNANSYTIQVATAATSSGSGGGAAVTIGSGLITVADNAHGFSNGDRVKLASVADVGGITAATYINIEHIIRNKAANTYDIMTGGTSTSGVTGGGSTPATRRGQIAAGEADASSGVGYSAGDYSDSEYSSALVSSSLNVLPRIWSFGPYGDRIIMSPGGQKGVYEWDADTTEAPVAVTNAPTAINYLFVDREFIITLGSGGVGNRVKTSDRGARTVWTGTAQNQAFEDDIEGAGTFITHASVQGTNLLFTATQAYTMSYKGRPAVWEIKPRLQVGIIAQNARVVANDVCYFMSQDNIYSFDGSMLRPLLTKKWRKYIFNNINRQQQAKCFLSYREKHNELIIRWPSAAATEIDSYVRVNLTDGAAAGGTKDRTAEEYPFPLINNPRAIDSDGVLYLHETGVNADGAAMDWYLETCFINQTVDKNRQVENIYGVIPDSIQTEDITLTCTTYDFPQNTTPIASETATISPTSTEVAFDNTLARGRLHKYRISGNTLNGAWRGGAWQELVSLSTPRT